jgi:hypothetical protein
MTARTVSMGAPFRWLMKAVDVGRRNPRALFGGFALLILVGLVPSAVQLGLQAALADSPQLMMSLYLLVVLASLVLMPPLTGGAIRLLHACETGQPASATDVFSGYSDRAFAVRMILTALLLLLVYLVVFGLLFVVMPGKEFMVELFARSLATPPGGQPDMSNMPAFPPSFLLWMLGASAVMLVLTHGYLLAFTQAALAGHGPFDAVLQGFKATFKNVLPLIGFTLVAMIVGFVAMLVVALVIGLLAGVLMLASPVLAGVVLLPIYLGFVLVMYVVMFGFYYHGWREIFGEPAVDPADAIAA